jgi:hypothetical protein
MSTVYVVQQPAYYDKTRRGWVNKYDLSPAADHGELVFLLRPSNVPKDKLPSMVELLESSMASFSVYDHILPVGDPVAIAAAIMVASSKTNGVVSLLKWDRFDGAYEPYVVDISGNNGSVIV